MSEQISVNTTCPRLADDFWLYQNFDFVTNMKMPEGYSRWSNFNILREENQKKIRDIVENSKHPHISNLVKIFEEFNEEDNKKYINGYLKLIDGLKSIEDVFGFYTRYLLKQGVNFIYTFGRDYDRDNSERQILELGPVGLVLPNKKYYFDEELQDKRDAYLTFIQRVSDYFDLKIEPKDILAYETKLAELHYSPEEKRDPKKTHNPIEAEKLSNELKSYFMRFEETFYALGKHLDVVNVTNPDFFKEFGKRKLFLPEDLKKYLKYKLCVTTVSSVESGEMHDIWFDFMGKAISGKTEPLPMWKRKLDFVDAFMGELVGQEYVNNYFSEEAKTEVEIMIKYYLEVVKELLTNNTWMTSETKEKALLKLSTFRYKIGYPSKWNDYKGLYIDPTKPYMQNIFKLNEWWWYYNQNKTYQPVDKEEWFMHPHHVNAYFMPSANEIVFPAGILQAPFFSMHQSPAENFGGIGTVIAHEITHGFDDQGRKYDHKGNLNDWWTEEDAKGFESEAQKLVDQFDQYQVHGVNLSGKLTLGENLADLGGVFISIQGLKKKLGDEFDDDVLRTYFQSFANLWKTICHKDEAIRLAKIDPHSPPQYRVNGILPHINSFYDAFEIKEGDKMFIPYEKRCKIWSA